MNIIPDTVEMGGTVRLFSTEHRIIIRELMEQIVKGITEAHGASYLLTYNDGADPVINDEEVSRVIEETVRELWGTQALTQMKPNMGGEDFSAFLKKAPGTFFFTDQVIAV